MGPSGKILENRKMNTPGQKLLSAERMSQERHGWTALSREGPSVLAIKWHREAGRGGVHGDLRVRRRAAFYFMHKWRAVEDLERGVMDLVCA